MGEEGGSKQNVQEPQKKKIVHHESRVWAIVLPFPRAIRVLLQVGTEYTSASYLLPAIEPRIVVGALQGIRFVGRATIASN